MATNLSDRAIHSWLISSLSQPLVGVIDTGFRPHATNIDYSKIHLGRDLVDGDSNPLLVNQIGNTHGSHILQTIANNTNNNTPLWVGRAVGSGRWAESLVEFVNAGKVSIQPNAIVNLSFDLVQVNPDGSVTTRHELTTQERAAIEYARQNGVLIVAAAGNEGGSISALGRASQEFDNIVTVGAADGLDRADYSSYGNSLTLLAEGDTGNIIGTSAAAARVTGAISQLWAANPELAYRQVIDILKTTATDLNQPGWDAETGSGLLNLPSAIHLAALTTPISDEVPAGITLPTLTSVMNENITFERPLSFWDDLWDIITKPIEIVVDGVVWTIDKIGDAVEGLFDTIGLDFLGDGVGWFKSTVTSIIGRETQFLLNHGHKIDDLLSTDLWENFGKWAARNGINMAERLGVDLEQVFSLVLTRKLSNQELQIAKSVFGDSINYDLVRINQWFGNDRAFVTLHTINVNPSKINTNTLEGKATLIHELTHVWQYEHLGAKYVADALIAQSGDGIKTGSYPPNIGKPSTNGYAYGGYTELQSRMDKAQGLNSFNLEQQAMIVEHYYKIRHDSNSNNDQFLPLYAHFIKSVSSLPLSNLSPLRITGTLGNEKIYGNNADNIIDGGSGNDLLKGWNGNDTLIGNYGNDKLYGGGNNDKLYGGADHDYLNGGTGHDYLDGWNGNDTLSGGDGNDKLYGGGHNDKLYGEAGNDYLNGGYGDDLLVGETYVGVIGHDTIYGGSGNDIIHGVHGNDYLHGDAGNDIIYAGHGKDYAYGGTGNDKVYGWGDNDVLLGGDGDDYVNGGDGNDIIYGTLMPDPDGYSSTYVNNDQLYGENGNDRLYGSNGRDTLHGGWHDDVLYGKNGDDLLYGGTYGDVLYGGEGRDRLIGFDARYSAIEWDEFHGGAGGDYFVLGNASKAFYAAKGSGQSDGWARIKDWDWTNDWIEVHGSANQYRLTRHNWGGSSTLDTGIVYNNNLICIVEDSTNVYLERDFMFV